MNHIEGTTPQLKLVDQMFEAARTLDMNNLALFLSKDFTYRSFPKTADLPDQTKEEHIEQFGPKFAALEKLDVRVQHRGAGSGLKFKSTPSARLPRSDRSTRKGGRPGSSLSTDLPRSSVVV